MSNTKRCSLCKTLKTWDEFYLRHHKPNGWCKDCYKTRQKEYSPSKNFFVSIQTTTFAGGKLSLIISVDLETLSEKDKEYVNELVKQFGEYRNDPR